MASRTSTPRSRSRSQSSTGSSGSSDTAMLDAPPKSTSRPVRLRNPSTSNPSAASQPASFDPSFSLLLSLPRELRERIYTFALTSPYPFLLPRQRQTPPVIHDLGVNLLRTNKQVYDEGISTLYSGNKFLFTHPSDCNIFRVVSAPESHNITCVFFKIREKDLRLWNSYLGSKTAERSLKHDLPKLKNLWIFMRCGSMGTLLGQLGHAMQGGGALAGLPPAVVVQVQAAQNALSQQIAALQLQAQSQTSNEAQDAQRQDALVPPPPPLPPQHPAAAAIPFTQFQQGNLFPHHQNLQPPPPPPPPHHNHHLGPAPVVFGAPPHTHTHHGNPNTNSNNTFLRFERETGIESLCLSLAETRRKDTAVYIVCIMRIPTREVDRLIRMYPEELDRVTHTDARTRFRSLNGGKGGGVSVSLEVSGYEIGASADV